MPRNSRSDSCRRARRASFAPIRSLELGVPESVPSIRSLRSSSATRKLHPPSQLPLSVQLLPQHRDLSVFRLHHGTQPRRELAMLGDHASQIRLTRHKAPACSTGTKGSNTTLTARPEDCPHQACPASPELPVTGA